MKATLVFNLSDPCDREEYSLAINGYKYKYAFDEVFNYLRSEYKSELSKSDSRYLEKIREAIAEIYNDKVDCE